MTEEQTDALAEIKAMQEVAQALEDVGEDARLRVLGWANERYGFVSNAKPKRLAGKSTVFDEVDDDDSGESESEYGSSSEFMAATGAKSEAERVLVIGYWFQAIEGKSDLGSQEVSTELKHLGHKVSNITRAFSGLMDRKPQLVVQLRKSGSTKQARKTYKLTSAGVEAVKRMLRGENDNDE